MVETTNSNYLMFCQDNDMSKANTITLDEAVKIARRLPVDTQAALANELMEHVQDMSAPDRPADRQDLIKDRLAKPLKAISRDELMSMLRRYNPAQ
jgi:hypothetical protein